jgi:hypothetical protein
MCRDDEYLAPFGYARSLLARSVAGHKPIGTFDRGLAKLPAAAVLGLIPIAGEVFWVPLP